MSEDDIRFLALVKGYVQKRPSIVGPLIGAVTEGTEAALDETMRRAADMETVAAMALNTRLFKGNAKYIADMLKKWNGKSALKWDDQIARLLK